MKITIHTYEGQHQTTAKWLQGETKKEQDVLRRLETAGLKLTIHQAYQKAKGTFTVTEPESGLAIAHGDSEVEARKNAIKRITTRFDSLKAFVQEVDKQTEESRFQVWLRNEGAKLWFNTFRVPITWSIDEWWMRITGRWEIDPGKVEKLVYHQRGYQRGTLPEMGPEEEPSILDRVEERFGKFARTLLTSIMDGKQIQVVQTTEPLQKAA